MKILQNSLVSLAIFIVIEGMTFGQDSVPDSLNSFAGKWKVAATISAGKVSKFDHEVMVEKDRMVWKRRGVDTEGETSSFTVDTSTNPKQITMIKTSGIPDIETGKPHKFNAVYVQTDKEIRISLLPGRNGSSLEERPKDMSSTDTNRAIVFILTRD